MSYAYTILHTISSLQRGAVGRSCRTIRDMLVAGNETVSCMQCKFQSVSRKVDNTLHSIFWQ